MNAILGIETSGRGGTIALQQDGRLLEEQSLEQAGRRHAQTLVAQLACLLERHHIGPRDCALVAVSIGPGSFTGLRVGVVCAKTLAYAARCPVVAVDTFEAIAENSPSDVADLYVISDAQRGELFVGHYERVAEQEWHRRGEIEIANGDSWCAARTSIDSVSGPGIKKFEAQLNKHCRVLAGECREPRAAAIARIGERRMASGETADLWSLEPFYLRRSAAEEKWASRN